MIFKRFAANLRAQNWFAIAIEVVIVIIGVFIGNQVSNWNSARIERAETRKMLDQLVPQLDFLETFFRAARPYYATTRRYADVAFAGWHGDPKVSDKEFVIAAYQASQIFVIGFNSDSLTAIMGADRLKDIDDPILRERLGYLMFQDYSQIDLAGIDTPYRQAVRRVISVAIQDRIRAHCNDRYPIHPLIAVLPTRCAIAMSDAEAADAARLLRARPDLMQDLQWHVANTSNFLLTLDQLDSSIVVVKQRLARE